MPRQAIPVPEEWHEIRRKHREERRAAAEPFDPESEEVPDIPTATYRNISRHDMFGAHPGEVVVLALTEGQREALLDAGALEEVAPEDEAAEEISADEPVATPDDDEE